jgi:hypothetical protein
MPVDSQTGRQAAGIAWIAVAVCLAATGCQKLAVVRQVPSQVSNPGPARTTVTQGPPGAESPVNHDNLPLTLPTVTDISPPRHSPTPILDEALQRAEALETVAEPAPASPRVEPVSNETVALPDLDTKPEPVEEKTEEPAPAPASTPAPAPVEVSHESPPIESKAEPKPINPDTPAEPASPIDPWNDGLERLRALARDRAGQTGGADNLWPLRSEVLDWVAKPDREVGDGTLWRTVLTALAAASGSEPSDDDARGALIRAAVGAMEDQAPLAITDLRLCRKVLGFGNFEAIDPSRCRAGMALIVYSELEGLRHEPKGAMQSSRLSTRVDLATARGGPTLWTQDLGTAEDVCRRRRRDYYVNFRINLPDSLPPGEYELRLTQTDAIAGRAASATIPLTVAP